jgi:hypothetical protein
MTDPKIFTVYNLVTYVMEVEAANEDEALEMARFSDESEWEFVGEDFDVDDNAGNEDEFELPF